MNIKYISFILFTFLSLTSLLSSAQEFPNAQTQKFILRESSNDYKPETTVSEAYRPGKNKIYQLQYLEIPVADLNITDSMAGSDNVRKQMLIEKNGKSYFRFFIHPDSAELYKPLISRYGWSGFYWAAATSSTRSVIAWNPNQQEVPLYLKLSLAQYQDGMGRIIPDWEVRRSVGISSIISSTPEKIWKKHGASIIPEFMGATVKKSEGLEFFVDENQKNVSEHGLIAREADFLTSENKLDVMPLFGLFTERNGREPLIITLWKKSGNPNFYDFVDQFLFKSFLEMNSYLFFHQGIVPEIHGQNVLIAYDAKTEKIVHYYHRDVGSMNVDLRLRYIYGLDITPLRTASAAFDFKFARATEKYESVHMDYLNDWLFKWGYLNTLKKYIPRFSPEITKARLKKRLLLTVREQLPLKTQKVFEAVEDHMKQFYTENPPLNWKPIELQTNPEKLIEFIKTQKENVQFMQLPESWIPYISFLQGNILPTEYGILKIEADKSLRLYYYASKNLQEVTVPKNQAIPLAKIRKKSTVKKIGFYSGTFDPPHLGHLRLIQKAIQELQLDVVYILPNLDPAHKPGATKNAQRLAMAKLAFADVPEAVIADSQQMRVIEQFGVGGLQRYISEQHKDDLVFQVMGDDSYLRIKENTKIQFPKNFALAVSARDENFELLETSYNKVRTVTLTPDLSNYSSTLFRKKIKAGEMPTEIKSDVLTYIFRNKLYQALRCELLFL